MANRDFYDFEEALDRLGLEAEELKRLVSEGEIRAFRDGDSMRLRAEDVEGLRRGIDEGAFLEDDAEDMTEELVFEEDSLGDDDVGMATTQLSEEETLLEEDVDLDDVGGLDEFGGVEGFDEELELPDDDLAPVGGGAGGPRIQRTRSRRDQIKEESEAKQGPIFIAISVISAILALVFGITSAIDASGGKESQVTSWWSQNIGKAFAGEHIPETLPKELGTEER